MYIRWKPVREGQSYIISVVESVWRDGRSHSREVRYVGSYTPTKHMNRQVFVSEMRKRIREMDEVPVEERERLGLRVYECVMSITKGEVERMVGEKKALNIRKQLVKTMSDCVERK